MPRSDDEPRRALLRELQAQFPGFREAVAADARLTARLRGDRHEFRSPFDTVVQVLRLWLVSDAFFGQSMYRLKASLQARGVPLLPRICHRLAMMTAQICIGDPVVVHPGVYILHGQVVIDGLVTIGAGTRLAPWVTIGLRAGNIEGPTIGPDVVIGTGAKVIGPVTVGRGATIGANAVVTRGVAAGETVAGIPARPVGQ